MSEFGCWFNQLQHHTTTANQTELHEFRLAAVDSDEPMRDMGEGGAVVTAGS